MTKEFSDKIIAVQKALKAPKSLRNTFGNYNYRSAEDVLEAVKPLLHEQGLLLTISDDIVVQGRHSTSIESAEKKTIEDASSDRVFIKAVATLSFGDEQISTTAFAREEFTKKGMDAAQITGSASSYARKYALNGLFLIDDNKDPDHDKGDNPPPPAKPTKPVLTIEERRAKICEYFKDKLPELSALFVQMELIEEATTITSHSGMKSVVDALDSTQIDTLQKLSKAKKVK